MNIHAKCGDRVRYSGCSRYQTQFGNCADPRGILKEGECYFVARTKIHTQHTKVYLQGFYNLGFNSVCFEDVDVEEKNYED